MTAGLELGQCSVIDPFTGVRQTWAETEGPRYTRCTEGSQSSGEQLGMPFRLSHSDKPCKLSDLEKPGRLWKGNPHFRWNLRN